MMTTMKMKTVMIIIIFKNFKSKISVILLLQNYIIIIIIIIIVIRKIIMDQIWKKSQLSYDNYDVSLNINTKNETNINNI